MNNHLLRVQQLIVALFTLFMLGIATNSANAGEKIYSNWFHYDEKLDAQWKFEEVDGEPNKVKITRLGSGKSSKKVFVLYPKPSSAYDVAISKILSVFAERDFNAEFMIFNFAKDEDQAKAAIALADANGSDLIYSMGSRSTAYLWKNYKGGKLPVISVCSKDPVMLGQTDAYDQGTGTNFAFTSLNMPVEVQMAYVLDFMPELRNFAILVDSKNVSAVETQAKPIAAVAKARGINVLMLSVEKDAEGKSSLESDVSSAVAAMKKSDPLLERSMFWITGSTSVFREIATINENSDRVPVLSVVPEVVKAGADSAVLSIGISFESNAHLAGLYGLDVLSKNSEVGEMYVGIVSPPDIAINFLKSREIGLEIPFNFIESASFIYGYEGEVVRSTGG